jgi:hypothetical protein
MQSAGRGGHIMPRFDLSQYVDVQTRVSAFWRDHPNGRIQTNLMSDPSDFTICRYVAYVYRDMGDPHPAADGWAFEAAGGAGANQTSHEENCATSAIGRALANLGYSKNAADRPSKEEMTKVVARDNKPKPDTTTKPKGAITTAQLRKIWAIANEKLRPVVGAPNVEATVKPIAYNAFGVDSLKALSATDAESFIDYLNRTAPAQIIKDSEAAMAEARGQPAISDDEAREIAWRERLEGAQTIAEVNTVGKEIAAAKVGGTPVSDALRQLFRQKSKEVQHQPVGVGALPGMPDDSDIGRRVGGFIQP